MFRIGQSVDIHALVENRDLILGGVKIEHDKGLLGHSDADALLHAIAESILGALALGDLGSHFPDTCASNKDRGSLEILGEVVKKMEQQGYEVNNVDALIMIEKPKMAPHIMQMRQNIATVLKVNLDQVSVKATRGEKLGFVGEMKGVQAHSVILLRKVEK